ncbi:MAG: NTP transferase domain-containing protein [Erysipelotrichaceae bacterium]|nr:NTP transferase domain-containing protein [Erysipelotrichaceae bacterium]
MFTLKLNSILVDEDNERFFGNGPMRLLEGVKLFGSLSASAQAMGMSYSKALKLIRRSEQALGFRLLESHSGGNGGGSSVLSEKGEFFLSLYKEFSLNNQAFGDRHLKDLFINEDSDVKIVILASGTGRRFEGNKLLYEVKGKPLIAYILDTLHPLRPRCIVSTVHQEIAKICETAGYETVLHAGENKSASIRHGISGIEEPCATLFVQGDQPLLTLTSVCALLKEHKNDPSCFCRLSFEGRSAAPVLFPADLFEEMKKLEGEDGGSVLIKKHPEKEIRAVEALFPWELWDVDERKDLGPIEDLIAYLHKEGR